MTPEEIQRTIEGMLAMQQELQRSQVEFRESLTELRQDITGLKDVSAAQAESINKLRTSIADLKEIGRRHDRRIEQLIGYSITGEGDRLDLLERFQGLERRVRKLEEK